MHVNKRELAEVFGASQPAIDKWHDQGLPILERGGPGKSNRYDTAEVHRWLLERAAARADRHASSLDLNAERARLAKAQADRYELELEHRRGEIVDTIEAMEAWGEVVQNVRARLLAIPSKAAPMLVGLKHPALAQAALTTFVHEALEELANPEFGSAGADG